MGLGKFFGLSSKEQEEKPVVQPEETVQSQAAEVVQQAVEMEIKDIVVNPFQPRRVFKEEALQELAASVREFGVLQPLLVRKNGAVVELIAGERRLRAARLAGLTRVPVLYKDLTDQELAEVAIIENLQREDLSFFEEAEGFARLLEQFDFTQESLACRMGISQSALANKLRLRKLPEKIRADIEKAQLTERHARVLLRLKEEKLQKKVLQQIVRDGLNVRQTDELVKKMLDPSAKPKRKAKITGIVRDARIYINTIHKATKQMASSGLDIQVEEEQSEDCVVLHIRVPKQKK